MITQQRSRKRPLIPTSKQDHRTNKIKQPSTRSHNNTILIVELLAMKAHHLERRRAFGRLSGVHDHVRAHVRIRIRARARVHGVRQRRVPPRGPRTRARCPARCPCTASPSVLSQSVPAVFCDLDAARARPIASTWVGRTGAGAGTGGCWDVCCRCDWFWGWGGASELPLACGCGCDCGCCCGRS